MHQRGGPKGHHTVPGAGGPEGIWHSRFQAPEQGQEEAWDDVKGDTNKAEGEMKELKDYDVRCRLVGRDFKGGERGRDDLFAETLPLEAKRMLVSKAATRRWDGRWRKLLFLDVRKAHLNAVCEEDVYIAWPEECEVGG